MADIQKTQDDVRSVLKMEHVVFDRIQFNRIGFRKADEDISFKARTKVDDNGNGIYRVTLNVKVEKSEEYNAEVQITGYFSIDENNPEKDVLLNKNAVAILFPYVRSEFSLLTAQPETDPIVLPVMNISAMLDKANGTAVDE